MLTDEHVRAYSARMVWALDHMADNDPLIREIYTAGIVEGLEQAAREAHDWVTIGYASDVERAIRKIIERLKNA